MSDQVVKPLLKLFAGVASSVVNGFAPGAGSVLGAGADALINRIQDNTGSALPSGVTQANGQTVDCGVGTSARNFSTKLGRKYTGYTITRNPTGVSVVEDPSKNDGRFISLRRSSAGPDVTVTISVF